MPGIVGICDFRRDGEELARLLGKMADSLCHETWYRVDRYVDAPLAMGRVSLGLLNPEAQPIFNEDRTRCIVLDGELYDYDVLKAQLRAEGHRFRIGNDVEFLLHWYEARGVEGLRELDGSFVLAVWESTTQAVTLVSDRYGLRPMYYAWRTDCLLFGSEVKALLADPSLTREVDHHAVADFFSFELLLGDKTFFSKIRALPPASALTFGRRTLDRKRYWDFAFCEEKAPVDEEAVSNRLDELWQSAVSCRVGEELATGIFLSGGLDSRMILGAAARRSLPIQTFTMGREGCYDMRFAQQMAATMGTEHHTLVLQPEAQAELIKRGVWLTDGMTNCIHMSILNLLPLARGCVDVVLDGLGGDVILKGDYLDSSYFNVTNGEELAQALFAKMDTGIQPNRIPGFFTDHFLAQIEGKAYESLREQVRRAPPRRFVNKAEYVCMRNRQRRFFAFGPIMTRSQLASRTPFYDNDLVDFIYSLPAESRQGQDLRWLLVARHYPDVAAIPWQFTGLPVGVSTPAVCLAPRAWFRLQREMNKVLLRLSRGCLSVSNPRVFTDYASWWRTVLKDWALGLILSPRALKRGYLDPGAVRRLVAQHMNGQKDHTIHIGILVTFELWHRMFVD